MTYGTKPWGSAPRESSKPDPRIARAYRAAGWDIGPSGKAIAPINRLAPNTPGFSKLQPRGFSRLPEPTRPGHSTKAPSAVPYRVASISEIPTRLRTLYSPASGGSASTGYVRGPHGDVLASYRDQKAADPLVAPITRRRTLTKTQWATLLSVAEPGPEREHFLRDAALKRIQIEE